MSIVYLAEDKAANTRVVVKQLREQYAFDKQLMDRFLRGATAVKDLRHPHLARVREWLERNGRFYTIEAYLPGGSLADLLKNNGPPSEIEALTWCRDALNALNYVHEFGIVHRDIKPSNLMLDELRQLRLIDFGIARVFGDKRLTRTGDGAIGTACYMSPEQIRTPATKSIISRTSIQPASSCMSCSPATSRSTVKLTLAVKETDHPSAAAAAAPRSDPGSDPALEKLVFKAMAKDPEAAARRVR